MPKGNIDITDTKEYDVTKYATAKIKDENLKAENIAEDVEVLGIKGTFKGGVDTSDGTATSGDILKDKVAYVNDKKVVGTIETWDGSFEGNAKNKEAAENDFRETYEQVDLLLLDDVQFLAKRSGVQLALLNVIERRRLHGRQTVFSSDRLPTEMDQRYFKAKFLNRLEECIALKLEMPDSKTRLGVVERATLEFPFLEKERHEICRWIATPAVDNFRTLIGKIKRLQAEYELQRKTLTLNSVRLFLLPGQSGRTLEAITAATAAAYGVECESLLSPSRIEKISFVRKIAMFICREDTGESLQTIGEFFGRNYSTVIASCNSVMTMLENNEDLAFRIQEIRYSFGK